MPFGVDDFLFLLASTSAVLWAKRGDFVEMSVFKAVSLSTKDDKKLSKDAAASVQQYHTPRFPLLRGFDLDSPSSGNGSLDVDRVPLLSNGREGRRRDTLVDGGDTCNHAESLSERRSFDRFVDRGVAPISAPLEYPNVPHRHDRSAKKRKQLSLLARQDPVAPLLEPYDTREELVTVIRRCTVGDLAVAHRRAERDGMWEQSVCLLQAAVETHSMIYLHKDNVEATLRTLLIAGQSKQAVHCYLQYAQDMLISDEILVTLFACCNDRPTEALAIYRTLLPYRRQWSTHIYACALTTNAAYDWQEALRLYDSYAADVLHVASPANGEGRGLLHVPFLWNRSKRHSGNVEGSAAAPSGATKGASNALAPSASTHVGPSTPSLLFLYHVIVPLVAQHVPSRLEALYTDMLTRDPNSAPDVLIRCLAFEGGQRLAVRYLSSVRDQEFLLSVSDTEAMRDWQLALLLYNRKRTTMNLNSLLRLFFRRSTPLPLPASVDDYRIPSSNGYTQSKRHKVDTPMGPISVAFGCKVLLASLKGLPVSQEDAVILTGTLTEQQSVPVLDKSEEQETRRNVKGESKIQEFSKVVEVSGPSSDAWKNVFSPIDQAAKPMSIDSNDYGTYSPSSSSASPPSGSQPNSLSALNHTTVATGAHWRVACTFAAAMAAQKHYHVLPGLAVHMARQGKWAAASRAMSIALSCRRGTAVSVPEMSLCVAASVCAGRWNSALFWIERAHTTRMVLPEATYDAALSVSKHCTWQVALRALTSMRHSGGMCTERGVLDLMEMASNHRQTELTLKALSWTNTVQWVP